MSAALRRRGRTAVIPALVVVGCLVGVVLVGSGSAQQALEQRPGSAWVVSPDQGLLSLIDGPSAEVAASVQLPGTGGNLRVEQAGSSAYVADGTVGTVARVDGATGEVSRTVQLGTADGGLAVLQGGGAVYVLDSARRTATAVDAETLDVERTLSLTAEPGPGQAVVDDDGRLWVLDRGTGSLTWFDRDKNVVDDGTTGDRLLLVRGDPVLVDTTRARVHRLDATGRSRATSCLEVRDDDAVELLGSRSGDEVFAAVPASGNLVVSDLSDDDCARVIPIADPAAADFGPLAQSGRYVFVPERTAGETIVVDTRDDTVAARLALVEPGHDVELIAKDGFVFYNDRDGSTAGVLELESGVWTSSDVLQKFDPETGEPVAPLPLDAPADPEPAAPAQEDPPADVDVDDDDPLAPQQGELQAGRREPVPGADRRPGAGTATEPAGTVDEPPTLGAISMSPPAAALGESVTFTVPSTSTAGGTWAWVLSVPSGPTVASGTTADSFTATLPTDRGLDFVLTLDVRTAVSTVSAAPLTFAASDSDALVVAPQPDAPRRYVGETSSISPGTTGADGGTWTWSARGPGGAVTVTQPAPGDALALPLDALGDYTVTLEVTSRGQRAQGSTTVTAVEPCTVTTPSPRIDLSPTSNPAPYSMSAAASCLAPVVVTTSGAGWLFDADRQTTIAPGATVSLSVGLLTEPSIGSHPGALTSQVGGVAGPSWDVVTTNFPPDFTLGGFVQCNSTHYALSVSDGSPSTVSVQIRAGGITYPLAYQPDTRPYSGYYLTTAGPPYLSTRSFVVTVRDSSGATTTEDVAYPAAAGCGVQ